MKNTLVAPTTKEAGWLFAAFFLFYFLFLGSHPLLLPDEGRYSEVAREMLASGDFITPRLNGSLFFHKPILFYWLQTIPISLFGINPWSLRIVPALLGVGGIVFQYWTCSLFLGRSIGLKSALILGTTPLYFGAAHYADMDLEVAVWLNACLLSLFVGIQHDKKSWLISAYIFGALAFLTKGLIGLAFPATIMGLWIVWTRQWTLIKKLQLPLGLALFFLITLPWLIVVSQRNPDFLHFFFYEQQFTRFAGAGFNNAVPWWFYIAITLGGFIPWTYFLLRHFKVLYRLESQQPTVLYLTIWALSVLIFFSIPQSKLVGYILPIFAPLAILTAVLIENIAVPEKIFRTILAMVAILALLFAGTLRYFPTKSLRSMRELVKALPQNIAPLSIVSYHTYIQDLPLYSQQTIRVVYHWQNIHGDNWSSELAYALAYDPAQNKRLIDDNTFWQLWRQKRPLYVFIQKKDLPDFTEKAGNFKQIAADKNTIVVTQSSSPN